MSVELIRQRIKEAVSRVAGISVDSISDHAHFVEDLRLDSLSIIESLVVLEQEFRLEPEAEDLEATVRSIDDAVRLVQGQLSRRAG